MNDRRCRGLYCHNGFVLCFISTPEAPMGWFCVGVCGCGTSRHSSGKAASKRNRLWSNLLSKAQLRVRFI
jgi:hypothetical protein